MSCIDATLRIGTKSPKVVPLLIFSISLLRPVLGSRTSCCGNSRKSRRFPAAAAAVQWDRRRIRRRTPRRKATPATTARRRWLWWRRPGRTTARNASFFFSKLHFTFWQSRSFCVLGVGCLEISFGLIKVNLCTQKFKIKFQKVRLLNKW